MSLTPAAQKMLYDETDARFYAQTAYAVGRKLDPNNWIDQPFIKVWDDIYRKVLADYQAHKLVTTHDHPIVQGFLRGARAALDKAGALVHEAVAAVMPADKAAYADAAIAAHAEALANAQKAASYQPATVDRELAAQAAAEVQAMKSDGPPPASSAAGAAGAAATSPTLAPNLTVQQAFETVNAAHAGTVAEVAHAQDSDPNAPHELKKASEATTLLVVGGGFAAMIGLGLLRKPAPRAAVRVSPRTASLLLRGRRHA